MFQRILVPLDGSPSAEAALPAAARLARASGGAVILLQVIHIPWFLEPEFGGAATLDAEEADTSPEAASSYLADLARADTLAGIPVITVVTDGPVVPTILAIAHEYRADLIVVCEHEHLRLLHWLGGSIAHRVTHHAPVPVLLLHVRAGTSAPVRVDVVAKP